MLDANGRPQGGHIDRLLAKGHEAHHRLRIARAHHEAVGLEPPRGEGTQPHVPGSTWIETKDARGGRISTPNELETGSVLTVWY